MTFLTDRSALWQSFLSKNYYLTQGKLISFTASNTGGTWGRGSAKAMCSNSAVSASAIAISDRTLGFKKGFLVRDPDIM